MHGDAFQNHDFVAGFLGNHQIAAISGQRLVAVHLPRCVFHGTGEPTDQIAGHVLQCGERAPRTVEIAGECVAPTHARERVHQFVGVPLRTIPGARVLDDRVDHSVFVQFARIERAGGDGVLHVMHAVGDVIGQVHHLAFDGTAGGVGRVLFEPGEHVRIIRIDAEFRTALPFRMRGGFGKRPRVFDGRIERGTRQIDACGTSVGKQYFRFEARQ